LRDGSHPPDAPTRRLVIGRRYRLPITLWSDHDQFYNQEL
jgi:hypothetical protein